MQHPNKPSLKRRLKIIGGQIRGLYDLVEKDTYCIDIITQTSAVKQALAKIEDMLLESHLRNCALDQMKGGKHNKAVSEILKVYKLKRK